MQKLLILFLFFGVAFQSSTFADDQSFLERELESGKRAEIESEGSALRKLQRGFLNVALSPLEISSELEKDFKRDTFPPSYISALGRGSVYAVMRAGVGIFEILTFPIPVPGDYEPVLQPEFPWELLPEESA